MDDIIAEFEQKKSNLQDCVSHLNAHFQQLNSCSENKEQLPFLDDLVIKKKIEI